MKNTLRLTIAAFGLATFNVSAATLYVSLESSNPVPPYATWATAATNIQHAVDAANAGDTVLVTNGVYAVGSRGTAEYPEYNLSRVMVTNAIRLESVNGPLATTIDGGGSMRCVYLGVNAVLSGFTLTSGVVRGGRGGGVFSEPSGVVTNCVITGNCKISGYCCAEGGGASGGNLYNCTLANNRTLVWKSDGYIHGIGGGASGSTLYNCTLTGNDGGAYNSTLYNSTVTGNSYAAGAVLSTLYNCTVTGNSEGGARSSTLYNCTLTGNSGEGANSSTLYNCTVTGNSNGGAFWSTLYNCTVTDNSNGGVVGSTLYNCLVTDNGGGSDGQFFNCTVVGNDGGISGTVFNSIIYYNYGSNYAEGTVLNNSCTSPLPTNGVGNITGHPLFMDMAAGDFRLREESPCIDAGTNLMGFPVREWRIVSDEVGYDWVVVFHITDPTDMLGNTRFIDGNFDGTVA